MDLQAHMLYNIHNRLGVKVCSLTLPASHTLQPRKKQLINSESENWQIGDQVEIAGRTVTITDCCNDSQPPALFIEWN